MQGRFTPLAVFQLVYAGTYLGSRVVLGHAIFFWFVCFLGRPVGQLLVYSRHRGGRFLIPCLRCTTGVGHFQVGLFLFFPLRGGFIRGKVGRLAHRYQLVGAVGRFSVSRLYPRRLARVRRQGERDYTAKGSRV